MKRQESGGRSRESALAPSQVLASQTWLVRMIATPPPRLSPSSLTVSPLTPLHLLSLASHLLLPHPFLPLPFASLPIPLHWHSTFSLTCHPFLTCHPSLTTLTSSLKALLLGPLPFNCTYPLLPLPIVSLPIPLH